jgi:hypothetical protein
MSTQSRSRDRRSRDRVGRRPAALLLGSTLLSVATGCAGVDGTELAEFRPLPPDGFELRAQTTPFYPPGIDTWAEGERLAWLATYVRSNGLCPYGYRLNSRKVTFEFQSPLGYPVDEIVYRGHCSD